MELFDLIKIIFEKPAEYEKVGRYDKAKNFFMINRFMSISYPIQANAFNHIRISQPEIIDYWHSNLRRIYTKTPTWMYVKTKKKKVEKIKMPSEEAISIYLSKTGYTRKSLDQALKFFGKDTLEPIFKIDKLIEEQGK